MRRRRWAGLLRWLAGAALVITGWPLLVAVWPWRAFPALPPEPADLPPVPGQLVVDARDDLTPDAVAALAREYGISLELNSTHAGPAKLLVARVPEGQEEALLARLRRDRRVEAADRMHRYRALWTPNDPRLPEQWNMRLVGAEQAWDRARGKGIVVAVIDTGVAFETDAKCYRGRDFAGTRFAPGYDFVHDDAHPNDDHGHGTHVAGTIAETTDNGEGVAGLAFEATIMPIKVLDAYGTGTTADIADGIRFAADHGARIINMSLGGPYPDATMRRACQYAAKKGVLIVCAAGNRRGGPVGYPAAFPECMAISAVGPEGELAPYSSIGKEIALAAPGGDTTRGEQYGVLQNTVLDNGREETDGYYFFQGTSMASPHVAATAALVMSRGVGDAAAVRQLLLRAATPKKPAIRYGAGILNAARSVELAADARRDGLLRLLLGLLAGLAVLVATGGRGEGGPSPIWPGIGFALGLLGPDLAGSWLTDRPWALLLAHSALVPAYLLWEVQGRPASRWLAGLAFGVGVQLAWGALTQGAPIPGALPADTVPWLVVNAAIALVTAAVAWRRGARGD